MTVKLKRNDIKTLIDLASEEINRVSEAKENYGRGDLGYFYHLVDIRNKLLAMPLDAELPTGLSDEELEKLFGGKGLG